MQNEQELSAGSSPSALLNTGDANRIWEWDDPEGMQLRVAGHQSRQDYLSDRVDCAKWVARVLALTPTAHVFEIGSGEGIMAREIAPQVGRLLCTDVSRSFLAEAERTCHTLDNIDYHYIDDDYLAALPSDGFDAGYSFNVFIHLNASEMFLYFRQIARILRPGGSFAVNFLDIGPATREMFRFFAERYQQASHLESKGFLTWYSLDVISGIALEAGLSTEREHFVNEGGVCFLVLRRDGSSVA